MISGAQRVAPGETVRRLAAYEDEMAVIEGLISSTLTLLPKAVVSRVAQRYVAGATLARAVDAVRAINVEGALATVDLLGEEIHQRRAAEAAVAQYVEILDTIDEYDLAANISLKLTQLGLLFDRDFCLDRVSALLDSVEGFENFLRIDMENHHCTDDTLWVYRRLREAGRLRVGVVLQAMLKRTPEDVRALPEGANVRLCKGIYREPPAVAWQGFDEVRSSFLTCLRQLFERGCTVAIATHDPFLVQHAEALIDALGLGADRYEFQMLLGVAPTLRRRLLDAGHGVRIYVPFGADWYAYSMRRLQENPAVAWHVLKALVVPG